MTTLIKNGLVYDGSGSAPVKKDILIRGKFIAKTGSLTREHADVVIDVGSAMVTPGFIDVTSHADHHMSLFSEPCQEDAIRQGVTTIIGGNCGASLAPQLRGSLESIREWGSVKGVNVNWHTVKEFFAILAKRKLGVNFGMLAGHNSLRRALTHNSFRDLTERELAMLEGLVRDAMKDGALGLSFGLEEAHAVRIPFSELQALAAVVAKHHGVLAAHLRDPRDELISSLEEVLSFAEGTGANIEISHLQPLKKYRDAYKEAAERIEKESARHRINFDVQPFDSNPVLLAELLPRWFEEEHLEKMHEHVFARHARERLLTYLKDNAPRECIVTHVPDASRKYLEGKSVKEFAARNELSYEEGLLKIMELTHLRATLAVKNVDTEMLHEYLAHPCSIVSTNSASFGKKEFKTVASTETFPAFLRFADELKFLSVEKAVEKITSRPAEKYGIAHRGLVKDGYYADIVILSNFEPTYVFVNGEGALSEGACLHTLSGAVISKTA